MLNPRAVRNYRILGNHDNPVSYIIVGAVDVRGFAVRCDHHAFPDARVLIDICPIDNGVFTDSDWRMQTGILKRLNETKKGVAHKAPYYYKFDMRKYHNALKAGMNFEL